MSTFEILQIGDDVEPTAGIPEGCELCGHCRMLLGSLPEGAPLPCGATRPKRPGEPTPTGGRLGAGFPPPPPTTTRGAQR